MRLLVKAMALVAATLMLAACSISSPTQLIADEAAVAPLPDAFTYYPYEAGPDGYVPSKAGSATFVRRGNDYVTTNLPDIKGELDVRFAPVSENVYLLAAKVGDSPAVVYGFARYGDGVLSIALTPDKQTTGALARERRRSMPKTRQALGGLTIAADTNAITIKTGTALRYLGEMYADGHLPLEPPAVALVAEDPSQPLPSRLVQSGEDWIRVP